MPRERKSAAAANGEPSRKQCAWDGPNGRCMLLGEWSPDTGGVELGPNVVVSARSFCAWHSWCKHEHLGGRYRNDFARWLDERRLAEKPWADHPGRSHWWRHEEVDLWEAVQGIRELPRRPARVPEHWSDREPEEARRFVPAPIAKWFFGLCAREVFAGELSKEAAADQLRAALSKHQPEDEVIE